MRSCDDGYPSCRKAEAEGSWCKNDCLTPVHQELAALLQQRNEANKKYMENWHKGAATRAKTTTHNARISNMNERIEFLRAQIKNG